MERMVVHDPSTVFSVVDSPVGPLTLTGTGRALTRCWFDSHRPAVGPADDPTVGLVRDDHAFAEVAAQLAAYFALDLKEFDLPLEPVGTPFQLSVWEQLRAIPYGATRSYGDLAQALGKPGASRAVGLANGQNPISIIVPCHRVIGADGSLTGFGGGLARKRFLLDLEAGVTPLL